MEEININERTQNVKIKGILNNSSSRSRRDSSSFKHVVFIEPNDMKRKSIDSDDKRKIKIKKIVNKKNKLSNKKINNKINNIYLYYFLNSKHLFIYF